MVDRRGDDSAADLRCRVAWPPGSRRPRAEQSGETQQQQIVETKRMLRFRAAENIYDMSNTFCAVRYSTPQRAGNGRSARRVENPASVLSVYCMGIVNEYQVAVSGSKKHLLYPTIMSEIHTAVNEIAVTSFKAGLSTFFRLLLLHLWYFRLQFEA